MRRRKRRASKYRDSHSIMLKLNVSDNSFHYGGAFTSPAFSLWRDKQNLLERIYKLLILHGVDLSNISFANGENVGEESIDVELPGLGECRLKYHELEVLVEDIAQSQMPEAFTIIQQLDIWLRASISDFAYRAHFFEFGGHGELSGGTVREFLSQHHRETLGSIEQNLPGGLIFNWIDSNIQGRMHLEVDESLSTPGGLFIRWVLLLEKDKLDFIGLQKYLQGLLEKVLAELGLEIEEAS